MRQSPLAAALLVALGFHLAAAEGVETLSTLLDADDACLAGDQAACSVSLLQRRGKDSANTTDSEQSGRRRRGGGNLGGDAAGPQPTAAELETFAAVVERLWKIDAPYRLMPGQDYKLNQQARAASLQSATDSAPGPLFKSVNLVKLQSQPCARRFIGLLDDYERDTGKAEKVTSQEERDVQAFVQELMQTPHMQYIYNVLVAWGTIKPGYSAFGSQVQKIWFTHYALKSRGPKVSSGFEHVFVGEEKYDSRKKQSTIIGLHNWIQFYEEEKKGNIDYRGYVGSLSKGHDQLVSVRFAWDDDDPAVEMKSVSSMLVGSSVPFEFAMLTGAFLGFGGKAEVSGIYFGDVGPAKITSFDWKAPEGQLIRTAYLAA